MKAFLLTLALATSLPAAERVALVVGCANYTADPSLKLDTPLDDLKDFADTLETPALGFQTIRVKDATRVTFNKGLREFKAAAQGAMVALVFFSGHGIEHEQENYLVTVNATLDSEDELPSQTMPLSEVMKALGDTQATVKLAVLDCCRNNPFATKSWHKTKDIVRDQVLRQLGEAEIPQATLVCFATGAGRKAAAVLDGSSVRSPFTDELIKEVKKPGQSLFDVFANVHDHIVATTNGKQVPAVKTDNALSVVFRKTVLVPGTGTSRIESQVQHEGRQRMSPDELDLWVKKLNLQKWNITEGHRHISDLKVGEGIGDLGIQMVAKNEPLLIYGHRVKFSVQPLQVNAVSWESSTKLNKLGAELCIDQTFLKWRTGADETEVLGLLAKGKNARIAKLPDGFYLRLARLDDSKYDPTLPVAVWIWTIPTRSANSSDIETARPLQGSEETVSVTAEFVFLDASMNHQPTAAPQKTQDRR